MYQQYSISCHNKHAKSFHVNYIMIVYSCCLQKPYKETNEHHILLCDSYITI